MTGNDWKKKITILKEIKIKLKPIKKLWHYLLNQNSEIFIEIYILKYIYWNIYIEIYIFNNIFINLTNLCNIFYKSYKFS